MGARSHTRPPTLAHFSTSIFSNASPKAAESPLTTKPLLPSGGLSSPCDHGVPQMPLTGPVWTWNPPPACSVGTSNTFGA